MKADRKGGAPLFAAQRLNDEKERRNDQGRKIGLRRGAIRRELEWLDRNCDKARGQNSRRLGPIQARTTLEDNESGVIPFGERKDCSRDRFATTSFTNDDVP